MYLATCNARQIATMDRALAGTRDEVSHLVTEAFKATVAETSIKDRRYELACAFLERWAEKK